MGHGADHCHLHRSGVLYLHLFISLGHRSALKEQERTDEGDICVCFALVLCLSAQEQR